MLQARAPVAVLEAREGREPQEGPEDLAAREGLEDREHREDLRSPEGR